MNESASHDDLDDLPDEGPLLNLDVTPLQSDAQVESTGQDDYDMDLPDSSVVNDS